MVQKRFYLAAITASVLLVFAPSLGHGYFYMQGAPNTAIYTAQVKTEKSMYFFGEPIIISGQVSPYAKDRALQITILDSSKKILFLQNIPVNEDGSFSLTIHNTTKWKKDTYTVLAQYGTSNLKVGTANFSFDPTQTAKSEKSKQATMEDKKHIKNQSKKKMKK